MRNPELVARVQDIIGARVVHVRPVTGGYTPALRLVCSTASASYFVKAGTTPLTSAFLRREISVYTRLTGPFVPDLVGWQDDLAQPILITEDLSELSWPPPWDAARVDAVLSQIHAMHQTPADIEPYAQVYQERDPNWHAVAAAPSPLLSLGLVDEHWLATALPVLLEYEDCCSPEGDCLCHWDLRSDNMAIGANRIVFVDWNLACRSNPRLDLGFWLPSLAFEGGPLPEAILPNAPEVAAWVSGFFASRRPARYSGCATRTLGAATAVGNGPALGGAGT